MGIVLERDGDNVKEGGGREKESVSGRTRPPGKGKGGLRWTQVLRFRKQGGWWCHSLSFRLQVGRREGELLLFPPVCVLPAGTLRDQEHVQVSSATDRFLSPEHEGALEESMQ